jgi:hypothetical protein
MVLVVLIFTCIAIDGLDFLIDVLDLFLPICQTWLTC